LVEAYAGLSESTLFRKGLARHLGLDDSAGYPLIAERFINEAETFIADVKSQRIFRPFKREHGFLSRFVG
jgi:hypothetical protein